jgi:hypothetical protein
VVGGKIEGGGGGFFHLIVAVDYWALSVPMYKYKALLEDGILYLVIFIDVVKFLWYSSDRISAVTLDPAIFHSRVFPSRFTTVK